MMIKSTASHHTPPQHRYHARTARHSKPPSPSTLSSPSSLISTTLAKKFMATAASLLFSFTAAPIPHADALLNSPNAQLPRTVDAALRRSIPAFNTDVRRIQDLLEDISFSLRIPQRKPYARMTNDLSAAQEVVGEDSKMLAGVLSADQTAAADILFNLRQDLSRLKLAVDAKNPDRTSIRLADCLKDVAALELLEAPGLPYQLPKQYASTLPILNGRAVVDIHIETGDGRKAFYDQNSDQGPRSKTTLTLVVDGYSAPITAGNFVNRVLKGEYNNVKVQASPVSILVGEQQQQTLPLEMLPAGSFEPLYRSPLYVREGELPTLPLSIYGSIAMAHLSYNTASTNGDDGVGVVSATEWFMYKFDKGQSGLSGLSFDEGEFGVFGYVTEGADILNRLENGDRILSCRVVQGADKLILPPGVSSNSDG